MAVVKMIKGMHKQLIAYLSLLSFLPIAAAAKRRKLRRREGETITFVCCWPKSSFISSSTAQRDFC